MDTPNLIKRVPVMLDRQRTMMIDWNAMYLIEEKLTERRGGAWVSMQDLQDITSLSVADMRTVIWAALIHEDEKLTEKQVGAMVHMGNMKYVCDRLAQAMAGDDQAEGQTTEGGAERNGSDPLEKAGGTG